MQNMNPTTILVVVVVVLAVLGGVFLISSGGLPQQAQEQQQEQQEQGEPREVRSISGRVTSVSPEKNSFVLLRPKEGQSFTVRLGEESKFIRLVFPFDVNNPPLEEEFSFIPEEEPLTIEDLAVDDQVFVRSQKAITAGEDIVNPVEVQVLP